MNLINLRLKIRVENINLINIYYSNARGLITNALSWISVLKHKNIDIAVFTESHFLSSDDININ
jgi:hypothetical protein